MRVVAAAVFKHPADQGHGGHAAGDEDDPESHGQAEETCRAGEAQNQRPPAPGAEVPLLAGAFVDFGVTAVFGTHAHALAGEPKVPADHAGQSADQEDPEGADPFRPVGQESVNQGDRHEEEGSGSKNP